jgi:tryptophan 2,3-dioxygenase
MPKIARRQIAQSHTPAATPERNVGALRMREARSVDIGQGFIDSVRFMEERMAAGQREFEKAKAENDAQQSAAAQLGLRAASQEVDNVIEDMTPEDLSDLEGAKQRAVGHFSANYDAIMGSNKSEDVRNMMMETRDERIALAEQDIIDKLARKHKKSQIEQWEVDTNDLIESATSLDDLKVLDEMKPLYGATDLMVQKAKESAELQVAFRMAARNPEKYYEARQTDSFSGRYSGMELESLDDQARQTLRRRLRAAYSETTLKELGSVTAEDIQTHGFDKALEMKRNIIEDLSAEAKKPYNVWATDGEST